LSRRNCDQRAAADGLAMLLRHADLASAAENVFFRIADDGPGCGLEPEIIADPVFVEAKKGRFVAREMSDGGSHRLRS
jgi:hypothetical protein